MNTFGAILIFAGSVFLLISSIGLLRMPDFLNRIHAGSSASILGTIMIICGIGFINPEWWPKLAVIILFVVFTSPISSHALARVGYYGGFKKQKMIKDELENSGDIAEILDYRKKKGD